MGTILENQNNKFACEMDFEKKKKIHSLTKSIGISI